MSDNDTNDLVERQGVNAGDPDPAAKKTGDVRSGGNPEDAPDEKEGFAGYPSQKSDEQLTGGQVADGPQPEQKEGASGQDAGLMD
ncbi:hypothetical protein [Kineosporia succinea]|uniref:Uncharacterized protein n=1 Tax=Kineosporia succinea TaxID=84632 RepID=A0ABT9NY88_9ACTN|nr:hypothetical protein [Kineosporia succinea]MDP9824955.1 hypothetical protein [Kineosporia succinea]